MSFWPELDMHERSILSMWGSWIIEYHGLSHSIGQWTDTFSLVLNKSHKKLLFCHGLGTIAGRACAGRKRKCCESMCTTGWLLGVCRSGFLTPGGHTISHTANSLCLKCSIMLFQWDAPFSFCRSRVCFFEFLLKHIIVLRAHFIFLHDYERYFETSSS